MQQECTKHNSSPQIIDSRKTAGQSVYDLNQESTDSKYEQARKDTTKRINDVQIELRDILSHCELCWGYEITVRERSS